MSSLPSPTGYSNSVLERQITEKEMMAKREEEEKSKAQMSAAERSIKTNLILGLIFLVSFSSLMFVPNIWRPYCYVIVFSVMKGALPVLTAIANFGTVKQVATQYWDYIKHAFHLVFK